jgi:UDP:flavonoid glycosyltransferase YjiC (YdhE family)
MSTFLFASIPVVAHTMNPLPFAQRLVERGHTVLWYAGEAFHDRLRAAGAVPIPYRAAEDFSTTDLHERFPEAARRHGISAIRWGFANIFVAQAVGRVADLRAVLAEHDVDAMLCDGLMYGVGLVHELGGPPWATFGDGPLPYEDADTPPFGPALQPWPGPLGRLRNRLVGAAGRRIVFAPAQRRYDEIRAGLGLPKDPVPVIDAAASPYLHLQGCTPAFEYPRTDLPGHVHWVGALRPDPPADWRPPHWWDEIIDSPRPVVLVSQGSLRPDLTELIVPAVRGLAGSDLTVVVTTGASDAGALATAYGAQLPANVRVADFVPYDLLLPHVDAFVTNGGYTGVTLALAHGVPLVQAGTTEEKAEIAARIHWSGVGVRLGTTRPTPEAVADGVRRVLGPSAYRARARAVKAQMDAHDSGREGATLLERLAETGQPVTRLWPALEPDGSARGTM